MSGIEVAGLVLGAVPVLIETIDGYRGGVRKLKSGFRKRKVIEKLGRALRYQKSIVEAITRNVLVQSGCENAAGASDAQLRILLQDKQIQEIVDEFLGKDNAQVFLDALVDCMADVSHATLGLATLVPALALVKSNTDVQAVLNANAASEKGQIQLLARLSMVFNLEGLEGEIDAIDRSTNSLDKFTRNVTAHHQPGQSIPSRKAIKLAKVLKVVRQNAVDLHSALTRQWVSSCHQRHELQIFLEDRVIESKLKQVANDNEASRFKVAFVGGSSQPIDFWHETLFHIEAEDHQMTTTSLPSLGPRIQFSTPKPHANPKLNVPDICAAITDAVCTSHYPIFYLAGTTKVAMTLHTQATATAQGSQISFTTFSDILKNRHTQNAPHAPLPWKWRMGLALKIASSFLQFIRTPWIQPSWSASTINVPCTAGGCKPDLNRPFLSADFSKTASTPANRQIQVKEDLLELGVLLLEIWHENVLETQFAQELSTNNVSFMRRACALQWLDDLQNPLPDLYFRAVSHCVSGLLTHDPRASEWDHPDLWKSVCENVIDPLSKVAQI